MQSKHEEIGNLHDASPDLGRQSVLAMVVPGEAACLTLLA